MAEARPLNELLSAALAELTGGSTDLEVYANLLRIVPPEGVEVRDVPALARVSKRSTKWNIGIAERHGWIARSSKSAKRLQLTASGRDAREEFERLVRRAEAAWGRRVGSEALGRLRAALESLVSRFDLELPHHPAGYGPADGSATGGVALRWGRRHALRVKGLPGMVFDPGAEREAAEAWEAESGGRIYVRETGQDWRPVPRGEGDTVSKLPLHALLSQALMAFTIDYEGCGGLSLARSGNMLRFIPDEGAEVELRVSRAGGSTALLPADAGLAGLERHAYAAVVPDESDKKHGRLTLTEKGRLVRDSYNDIVVAIEDRWKRRYGAPVVSDLRRALAQVP